MSGGGGGGKTTKRSTDRRSCATINVALLISLPIAVLILYDVAVVRGYVERQLAERTLWASLSLNLSRTQQEAAMPILDSRTNAVRHTEPKSADNLASTDMSHRIESNTQSELSQLKRSLPLQSPPANVYAVSSENHSDKSVKSITENNSPQHDSIFVEKRKKAMVDMQKEGFGFSSSAQKELKMISTGTVSHLTEKSNSENIRDTNLEKNKMENRKGVNASRGTKSTNSQGQANANIQKATNSTLNAPESDTTVRPTESPSKVAIQIKKSVVESKDSTALGQKSIGEPGNKDVAIENKTSDVGESKHETALDREHVAASKPNKKDETSAQVLMVVLAIPDGYPGLADIASRSHIAYAKRHNYRLIVQREYLGNSTYGRKYRTISMQKLLAPKLLQHNEDYVVIVDYDVVIAPWSPPIHEATPLESGKAGIVDESQPSLDLVTKVLFYRTGRTRVPSEYYRSMGFDVTPKNGLLNTGVLVFRRHHSAWLESLYYRHIEKVASLEAHVSFHYEQALIGAELIRNGMVGRLEHAWNRNWMWYNYTHLVGGQHYDIGQVFRASYFVHFLWAKNDMPKLDEWMRNNNVTFEPAPYASRLLP